MKVIPPIAITSDMVETNAPEPGAGEAVWNAATNYAAGNKAIRTQTHRVYERIAPGGVDAATPETAPDKWLDIGPTNAWRMFDLDRNSGTELASPLTVTLEPGRRNSAIGLAGLVADAAQITVKVAGVVVYTHSESLMQRRTTRWSQYYFGGFRNRKALARFDLPMSSGAEITVTLTRASGPVRCGGLVLGMAEDIGQVIDVPVSDALNFSEVERDRFGNAALVKRRSLPKTRQQLLTPKERVDRLLQLRADLDAVPAFWSGLDDRSASGYFEALLICGIYKEFSISLQHPTHAIVNLALEEI